MRYQLSISTGKKSTDLTAPSLLARHNCETSSRVSETIKISFFAILVSIQLDKMEHDCIMIQIMPIWDIFNLGFQSKSLNFFLSVFNHNLDCCLINWNISGDGKFKGSPGNSEEQVGPKIGEKMSSPFPGENKVCKVCTIITRKIENFH